jgi:perosamine synthetase
MNTIDVERFHSPEPVPAEGIRRAAEIMQSGRMFRYLAAQPEDSEVSLLERDFAKMMGTKYALAVNSCSSAIMIALRAAGATIGAKVLVPSFTFTAVPSAIVNVGAVPVLVEVNSDYRVDLNDLIWKIVQDANIFLLSHMRGQISDLDAIMDICDRYGITLIEDAAHGLGALWAGKPVGSFGKIGCFSFQSAKIVNAGEGGIFTTNDPEMMAKAVILSGAYEALHKKHFWSEDLEEFFVKWRQLLPLYNMRMNEYTAAVVRPQLGGILMKAEIYRAHYSYLTTKLSAEDRVEFPEQYPQELRAPDSVQFRVRGFSPTQMRQFVASVKKAGIPLSAFGADPENARVPWNWKYLENTPALPLTRLHLAGACDMRLPSTLTYGHLDYLADAVIAAIREVEATS